MENLWRSFNNYVWIKGFLNIFMVEHKMYLMYRELTVPYTLDLVWQPERHLSCGHHK